MSLVRKLFKRFWGVRRVMRAGQLYPGLTLLLSWGRWARVEKVVLHDGVLVTVHLERFGAEELKRDDEVEVLREGT